MSQGSIIASWLWKTIAPVFLVVGTAGNVLSVVVLTRPDTRKSSTALYLTALAVSDLTVLYTGLLRWWLIHMFGVDVRLLSDVGCRFHWFFIFASTELSSWLLVAVTGERIISIIWPHKVRVMCTQKSAIFTIVTIVLSICGGSTHLLYGMSLRSVKVEADNQQVKESIQATSTSSITDVARTSFRNEMEDNTNDTLRADYKLVCGALTDEIYNKFFNFVYPWMDLLLYFFIPAIILSIGEVLIIRKIVQSRRLRLRMICADSAVPVKISDKSTSITVMLLTVNTVFILCTTPISIYLIGMPYWVDSVSGFTELQEIGWSVVNLLMYLNHSINFILYLLSGARFRQKVFNLFRRKHSNSLFSRRDTSIDDGHHRPLATESSVSSGNRRQESIESIGLPNNKCCESPVETKAVENKLSENLINDTDMCNTKVINTNTVIETTEIEIDSVEKHVTFTDAATVVTRQTTREEVLRDTDEPCDNIYQEDNISSLFTVSGEFESGTQRALDDHCMMLFSDTGTNTYM